MKNILVVLCFLCFNIFSTYGEDSVLWWMFDQSTEIADFSWTGGQTYTIDTLTGRGEYDELKVNAIRIGAYDGDSLIGYLSINDDFGEDHPYYQMPSYNYDTGGDSWNAGPTYANIGNYANNPSVVFQIELGNWDSSLPENEQWRILAHSEQSTYSALSEYLDTSDFEMHTTLEWTGGQYVVPEPNNAILMIFGLSILLLRRKLSK